MNCRRLADSLAAEALGTIQGCRTGRIIQAEDTEYPIITYSVENIGFVTYGTGRPVLWKADIIINIWDKDRGFACIDGLLEAAEAALTAQEGQLRRGSRTEYVIKTGMADKVEPRSGSIYCCGTLRFRVGFTPPGEEE